MKKFRFIFVIVAIAICSFIPGTKESNYRKSYTEAIDRFEQQEHTLCGQIKSADISTTQGKEDIKQHIEEARLKLKAIDFWLRYLEPVAYNKINGPLPVEWENEVFEKFEPPYRREGAGLSLAEIYLDDKSASKDSVLRLVQLSFDALKTFKADSIVGQLDSFDHFFYANRLYLLNLAAIYTTGFECPGNKNIIPELRSMVADVKGIYSSYNSAFPTKPVTKEYLDAYEKMIVFVNSQPADFTQFNHYIFIKDFVNPLFAINQKLIAEYKPFSISYNDFTLSNTAQSIFDKMLYAPQNTKGIYSLVEDKETLAEIKAMGKTLFYDPILSGNNQRSCASCHKPNEYLTDTSVATSLQYNRTDRLPRNTPTLINSVYNHLLMLDGKHITLQAQGRDVMTNPKEMGGEKNDILRKVMSCKEYRTALNKFLKLTPEEHEVTIDHIISAITYYYSDYSSYSAPFDDAMNNQAPLDHASINGFNLFMGKAQCGTCHYVPQFNGVKPPFISSEFEVIGVPEDTTYKALSADKGRYGINPAPEMMNAFRTGSIRNSEYTKPYMHNGVFHTLDEVIDFYNAGGGVGKKLEVKNQTLSADSLKLTPNEKKELISFIHSLNEHIIFQSTPEQLPHSSIKELNTRKVGGEY